MRMMRDRQLLRTCVLSALLLSAPGVLRADDPPQVDHQPVPCTDADKPIALCATASDDNAVAKVRIYFRPAGEDFYSFVDMVFGGISYCGTLPPPRAGKIKSIEYYIQAVDDAFQPTRTSTFQLAVQSEGQCEFPPIEKDPKKAASIRVYATHKRQGSKLPDQFAPTGVTFVPVTGK
jgi:hypothetical protein